MATEIGLKKFAAFTMGAQEHPAAAAAPGSVGGAGGAGAGPAQDGGPVPSGRHHPPRALARRNTGQLREAGGGPLPARSPCAVPALGPHPGWHSSLLTTLLLFAPARIVIGGCVGAEWSHWTGSYSARSGYTPDLLAGAATLYAFPINS